MAIESVIQIKSTEALEADLRELSTVIESDKRRYNDIAVELKHRRETKDERSAQPTPMPITEESLAKQKIIDQQNFNTSMTNKLIAMEAEQARLVIEVEAHKAARIDAEERLALIAKVFKPTVDAIVK